ncbi:hypothetical protein O3P69_014685 [Scylla paramamosain]|uniref:Uncharacterized protein n=1 Tax=Scylla paramamosain TaxID=85552 RepID=A0AAW0TZ82_SCYPA
MATVNGYSHQVQNGFTPLVVTVNGHTQQAVNGHSPQKASVNGQMQQIIDGHSPEIASVNGHTVKKASVNGHNKKGEKAVVTLAPSPSSTPTRQGKKQPQILTLYPSSTDTQAASTPATCHHKTLLLPDTEYSSKKESTATPWKDTVLKKLEGQKSGQTLLWLPGSGRHVSEGPDSYRPFTHITRTLHLDDALQVCTHWRIPPKNVITFSSIDSRCLLSDHPCRDLRVLWFSANVSEEEEDEHNWYGNVEFAVSASVLLECWRYCFMVEMMTTPTHTTSRILLTNTDFSSVLRPYNPFRAGGPWQVSPEGQMALHRCSRYKFKGYNRHPHILEFLLDVTEEDEKKILQECQLSFKNHEEAQDLSVPHVCNRHQRAKTPCPSPFPRTTTATVFVSQLQMMKCSLSKIPKLSSSAKQLYNKALLELGIQTAVVHEASLPSFMFVNSLYSQ